MKFTEFEFILKHSKLITEINKVIDEFNNEDKKIKLTDLDNPDINIYATLTKLSIEAKKELIYLLKNGLIAIRFSIIYGKNKPENIHYEMNINIKQESSKYTVIRDHTCLYLTPKIFTELLTILTKYKLDFLLVSENLNHEDAHIEDDNDFKIFNSYQDAEYDLELDDYFEEDEDEEDNSF